MAVLENLRRRNDPMNTKTDVPMPRVANMPAPTRRAPAPVEYDEDVLRVAAKQIEAERKIAALQLDVNEWQRQALDAQREVTRLEGRLEQEKAEHDNIVGKLIAERDYWKDETTRVTTCARNGAVVFHQILDPPHRASDKADKAGLAAVADELMKDALPRVVSAGPRDYPQKDEPTDGAS